MMTERHRQKLLAKAERRAFARMWVPSTEPRPVASLLSAATPPRKARHRLPMNFC